LYGFQKKKCYFLWVNIFFENLSSKSLFETEKTIVIKRANDKLIKIVEKIVEEKLDEIIIIDIMKECNWIWKKRLKVKEIGWTEYNNIDRKIEESLRGGRKIEAIKTYRKHKIDNGEDCSLREAKEYIDKVNIKMGLD